jgi:hypothetical protein
VKDTEPAPKVTAASSSGLITRGRTPPASVSQAAPVWRATPAARAAAVIVVPRRSPAQNTSRTSSLLRPPHGRPVLVGANPSASGPSASANQRYPVKYDTPDACDAVATEAPARNSIQNSSGATNRPTTNTSTQVLHRFLEPEA